MKDQERNLKNLLWYLQGDENECKSSELYSKDRRKYLPPIASPINWYINEVNRFLFSGGLNFSMEFPDFDSQGIKSEYLEEIINFNDLQSKLYSIWELGAIEGELLLVPRLVNDLYQIDVYTKDEFEYIYKEGKLYEVIIKRYVHYEDENKTYIYRMDIDQEKYTNYPLVPEWEIESFKWEENGIEFPHEYGFTPVVIIKNRVKVTEDRGISDFNHSTTKQAAAILLATYDALENIHLFGNPLFISPDPKDTLDRLKNRVQVLESSPDSDGRIDSLKFNSISSQHLELIDKLEKEFNNSMGIARQDVTPNEMSSLALRILNSSTIAKAESKWTNYVESGLRPLMEMILIMSSQDGILSSINRDARETYAISILRNENYFPMSPQEQVQNLEVATRMVELGVDRAQALKETIWSHLSIQEIEARLNPNLEDI